MKSPMKPRINILSQLLDLIIPRSCVICDKRLSTTEEVICGGCNIALPRTDHIACATDNAMSRIYWAQAEVARAAALFHYSPHTEAATLIYALKYGKRPDIGLTLGRMLATEWRESGFFDEMDILLPIPLTKERQKRRGYNQSEVIAQGIAEVTGLPIETQVLARTEFKESQTLKDRAERLANVQKAFMLSHPERITGKHVAVVDDVVTTGATTLAIAQILQQAQPKAVSIIALGYAGHNAATT